MESNSVVKVSIGCDSITQPESHHVASLPSVEGNLIERRVGDADVAQGIKDGDGKGERGDKGTWK